MCHIIVQHQNDGHDEEEGSWHTRSKPSRKYAPSYTCEYNKKGGITGIGEMGMVQKRTPCNYSMAKLGVYSITQHAAGTTVSKQGPDSCQERSLPTMSKVRLSGEGKEQGTCFNRSLAAIPATGCSMSANNGSLSRSPFL